MSEALDRIEAARSKPVAFAVRANVSFFGVPCDDCPASGNQVTFEGKINLLVNFTMTGFFNGSDFLRRTPPRPDEIAAQTLLEDIVKGLGCSFSVLSMVADNRKYRKNRK